MIQASLSRLALVSQGHARTEGYLNDVNVDFRLWHDACIRQSDRWLPSIPTPLLLPPRHPLVLLLSLCLDDLEAQVAALGLGLGLEHLGE